jgi:1-acyl-sn-glycerol-3-phosphate acyltransferase
MNSIIVLFALILCIAYENIKCKFKNKEFDYKNENGTTNNFYKFLTWFLGWSLEIKMSSKTEKYLKKINKRNKKDSSSQSSSQPNKILLVINHENLSDFTNVSKLISDQFTDYKIMYVMNKALTKLPGMGGYFKKNSIINDNKNLLKNIKEKVNKIKDQKIVVVIFPEGKIFNTTNVKDRDNFYEKNYKKMKLPNNKHTLIPKCKGIFEILKIYNPDITYQVCLSYADDIERKKARFYKQMLTCDMARNCIAELSLFPYKRFKKHIKSNNYDNFRDEFYDYWNELDHKIGKIYLKYKAERVNVLKKSKYYYDKLIPINHILWNSSKYLFFVIPFAFMYHGIIYALLASLLLFTSYQYHYHGRMKYYDVLTAMIVMAISYCKSNHIYSKNMLLASGGFYIINKFIEMLLKSQNNMHDKFLHSILHVLAYGHIFVDYLFHNNIVTCNAN